VYRCQFKDQLLIGCTQLPLVSSQQAPLRHDAQAARCVPNASPFLSREAPDASPFLSRTTHRVCFGTDPIPPWIRTAQAHEGETWGWRQRANTGRPQATACHPIAQVLACVVRRAHAMLDVGLKVRGRGENAGTEGERQHSREQRSLCSGIAQGCACVRCQ